MRAEDMRLHQVIEVTESPLSMKVPPLVVRIGEKQPEPDPERVQQLGLIIRAVAKRMLAVKPSKEVMT